jgi:hypothetical protein
VPVVLVLAVPALGAFLGIRAVRKRMGLRKKAVPDAG